MNSLYKIAEKHTPKGCKVSYTRKHSLHGLAWPEDNRMIVPEPRCRKALYLYLHECAHIHLKHLKPRSAWDEEMEAEIWAHKIMRKEGIEVPKCMTTRAKQYVYDKAKNYLRFLMRRPNLSLTKKDKTLLRFLGIKRNDIAESLRKINIFIEL